ncbi:MAG: M23 family metallopeptidase [Psychrobacter sp.]|uniref:M23 family metallopeptidase n=1 Tax=Psychrobacter sp. AOP7-B1-24 TaxID=3457645 RepID=UPI003FB9BA5B
MLADKRDQPPTPSCFSRVLSVLIKAAVLIALLFVFDKLLPSISQQAQSFVVAKWQQLSLLQQELPTENSLPSPLPGQNLTDTWGAARSQGRSHEGIDIFAARGTPIQSATQGIVRKVGENNLGGLVVVVVGPGGAGHYYAHLEDYADIDPDDWVNVGDTIGYVGDSGNAKGTPPHLHYGIYINGSAVNPYPLLQKE